MIFCRWVILSGGSFVLGLEFAYHAYVHISGTWVNVVLVGDSFGLNWSLCRSSSMQEGIKSMQVNFS